MSLRAAALLEARQQLREWPMAALLAIGLPVLLHTLHFGLGLLGSFLAVLPFIAFALGTNAFFEGDTHGAGRYWAAWPIRRRTWWAAKLGGMAATIAVVVVALVLLASASAAVRWWIGWGFPLPLALHRGRDPLAHLAPLTHPATLFPISAAMTLHAAAVGLAAAGACRTEKGAMVPAGLLAMGLAGLYPVLHAAGYAAPAVAVAAASVLAMAAGLLAAAAWMRSRRLDHEPRRLPSWLLVAALVLAHGVAGLSATLAVAATGPGLTGILQRLNEREAFDLSAALGERPDVESVHPGEPFLVNVRAWEDLRFGHRTHDVLFTASGEPYAVLPPDLSPTSIRLSDGTLLVQRRRSGEADFATDFHLLHPDRTLEPMDLSADHLLPHRRRVLGFSPGGNGFLTIDLLPPDHHATADADDAPAARVLLFPLGGGPPRLVAESEDRATLRLLPADGGSRILRVIGHPIDGRFELLTPMPTGLDRRPLRLPLGADPHPRFTEAGFLLVPTQTLRGDDVVHGASAYRWSDDRWTHRFPAPDAPRSSLAEHLRAPAGSIRVETLHPPDAAPASPLGWLLSWSTDDRFGNQQAWWNDDPGQLFFGPRQFDWSFGGYGGYEAYGGPTDGGGGFGQPEPVDPRPPSGPDDFTVPRSWFRPADEADPVALPWDADSIPDPERAPDAPRPGRIDGLRGVAPGLAVSRWSSPAPDDRLAVIDLGASPSVRVTGLRLRTLAAVLPDRRLLLVPPPPRGSNPSLHLVRLAADGTPGEPEPWIMAAPVQLDAARVKPR